MFVIGVISSVTAVIIYNYYKKRNDTLDYGHLKIIDEIKSEINTLRNDLISKS